MMNYIYHCQVHADNRKNKIVKIPLTTRIADKYLFGLDNLDFVKTFLELQDIAISIYGDMINDPESYGLKLTPAYKDGAVNLVNCFGNILFAFGILGQLSDGELIIVLDSYKKKVQKHKYNKVQSKLQEFGFVIKGFNGKSFNKGIKGFSVTYPDNPSIITVIKAFSNAVQPFIDNASTDKFYIDDIFNLFSFRPLENKTMHKHETMFLMMTDYYNEKVKETLYTFHEKLKMLGFKYPLLFGSLQYLKNGSRRISFGYGESNDSINGRIVFNDINKLGEMIKTSNEKMKAPFYNSSCHFCGGQTNPDNPCPKRVAHEFDGKTYYNCKMVSFIFNDIQYDDIDFLIQLIKAEYNV